MKIIHYIRNNLSKILVFLFALILCSIIYIGVKKMQSHSIVIGHPSEIIVISPENSQDVIVIGDPDKVNVKPRKNK